MANELERAVSLSPSQGAKSYLGYGPFGAGKTTFFLGIPGKKFVIDADDKLNEMESLSGTPDVTVWSPGEKLGNPKSIEIAWSPNPENVKQGQISAIEPQGYKRIVKVTNELLLLSSKNEMPYDVVICDSLTRVSDHWVRLLMYTHQVSYITQRLWGIYSQGLQEFISGFLQLKCTRVIISHDKVIKDKEGNIRQIRPSIAGQLGDNLGREFSEVYYFLGRSRDGKYKIQTVKDSEVAARTSKANILPEEIADPKKFFQVTNV